MSGKFLNIPHNCDRPQGENYPLRTTWQCDDCGLIWTNLIVLRPDVRAFCRYIENGRKGIWTYRDPNHMGRSEFE